MEEDEIRNISYPQLMDIAPAVFVLRLRVRSSFRIADIKTGHTLLKGKGEMFFLTFDKEHPLPRRPVKVITEAGEG